MYGSAIVGYGRFGGWGYPRGYLAAGIGYPYMGGYAGYPWGYGCGYGYGYGSPCYGYL